MLYFWWQSGEGAATLVKSSVSGVTFPRRFEAVSTNVAQKRLGTWAGVIASSDEIWRYPQVIIQSFAVGRWRWISACGYFARLLLKLSVIGGLPLRSKAGLSMARMILLSLKSQEFIGDILPGNRNDAQFRVAM